MAAVCEIAVNGRPCGVSAIGRCSADGRAFCGSHQAIGRNPVGTQVFYADMCAPCLQQKLDANQRIAAQRETTLGKAYLQDGARRDLVSAGITQIDVYYSNHFEAPKRFGRSTWVEHREMVAKGWLIGDFRWKHREYGAWGHEEDSIRSHPTVFVDHHARIDRPSSGRKHGDVTSDLIHVNWDDAKGIYVIDGGGIFDDHIESVTSAIHRLAGR